VRLPVECTRATGLEEGDSVEACITRTGEITLIPDRSFDKTAIYNNISTSMSKEHANFWRRLKKRVFGALFFPAASRRWARAAMPVLRGLGKVGDGIGRLRGHRFVFDSDALEKLTGSARRRLSGIWGFPRSGVYGAV